MTYRDRLAAYLRANEGRWIDGDELRLIGGKYAYRTRLSECRVQLHMQIDNRLRRLPGGVVVSEYKYTDPSLAQGVLFRRDVA